MRISYNPLWKMLIDRGMNKKELRELSGISTASMAKLGKGDNIISTLICGENETIHVVFETGKEIDIPVNGIEPGSSISPGKKLGARVAKAFMHIQQ